MFHASIVTEYRVNASLFFANTEDSCKALTASGLRRSGRQNRLIINDLRYAGDKPDQNARRKDYKSNICY